MPLVPGENAIVAEATDATGNTGSAVVMVVGGEAPTVAITLPLAGALVAPGLVTVSGTVTGVPEPTVAVNGVAAAVGGGVFAADVPVSEGANTLVATATNAVSSASDHVLATAGTAPSIAVQSPADGASTEDASVTVTGTVSGTAPVEVSVEGVAATMSGGTFSTVVPLETGLNTLVATATNAFGSDSDQVTVTRSSSVVVAIEFPADGAEIESSFVTVQMDAFSSVAPIANVFVNGSPAFLDLGGSWILTIPLATGENTITAVATDELGNTGSASVTVFRIDPIFVTIDQPAPGAIVTDSSVLVTGEAPGATKVIVNGVQAGLNGDQYSAQIILVEELNTILVEAAAPGRAGSASRSVELDTTPPAITVDTPGDGTTTARDTVTVRGRASDANGISEIRVDGVPAGVGPSFVGTAILMTGTNTVTVEAMDDVGNVGSASVQVTYDPNQPLAISIETPSDGVLLSSPRVDVAGSVSDPMAVVTLNGTSGAISGSQYAARQVPLAEGENVLVATATRGSQSVSASVTVTFNQPPDVRITRPAAGVVVAAATMDVAGIVDDAAARVDVNGVVARVGSDGRFVALGVPLAVGENELVARAVDLLGAVASDGVTVERRDEVASRLRMVLVDPARCPFPEPPSCIPVDLVVEEDEDFANGLAEIGLPRERFLAAIDEAAVADHVFHAFVFAEAPRDVTLRLAGPGPAITGAESPRTLEPIGGLAAEVAEARLDPSLAETLPPNDFAASHFTRFVLSPVQPGLPLTVTVVPYGGAAYRAGDTPGRVIAADFNEDGSDDIVAPNTSGNDISLLISNGDDTFQAEVRLPSLLEPFGVAADDLDGDSHLDIVTMNRSSDRISVLLGNGDGTFRQPVPSSFAVGGGEDVLLVDLDNDDVPDAVTHSRNNREIHVLLGNGDGTFQGASIVPTARGPVRLAAGDVDGDGSADLVAAADGFVDGVSATVIEVFLGHGTGQFTAEPSFPILENWEFPFPQGVALGDFDVDGDLDLTYSAFVSAISSRSGPVGIRLGNGDGTFGAETEVTLTFAPAVREPVDMDGDGDLDLVAVTTRGITTLENDGSGSFSEPETVANSGVNQGAIGDVNGDGFADVVSLQSVSAHWDEFDWVTVYTGRGDGTLRGARYTRAGRGAGAVVAGDWNGDGLNDALIANGTSHDFSLLVGRGDGTFEPQVRIPGAASSAPADVVAADFDGDGNLDFAAANNGTGVKNVSIHLGRGDGFFSDGPILSPVVPSPFGPVNQLRVGDVDGNGTADVIVRSDPLSLYRGLGDGSFGAEEPLAPGGVPLRFDLRDVDGDGSLDLVWVADDPDLPGLEGAIFVNLGSGNGSFAAPAKSATEAIGDDFALADVDHDGDLDAAILDGVDGVDGFRVSQTNLMIGNGDGTFQSEVTIVQGDRADGRRIITADLDQDGNPDFAVLNQLTPALWLARGNGDGTFRPFEAFAVGPGASALVAADLDGEGGLDLVLPNPVPTPDDQDLVAVLLSELPGTAPDATGRLLASGSDAADGVGLRLDVAAPRVRITSPATGITLSGSSLTLSGTVDDTVPEGLETLTSARLGEVAYRVADDLDVTVAEGLVPVIDGRFTIPDVAIGTGAHCATVEALDAAGNVGQDEVCVTADPTAPVVSVVSPQPGSTVPFDAVRLDLLFSATTTLVAINGVPDGRVFPAGLAVDVATLPLEVGANTVDLGFDAVGVAFGVSTTVFRSDVLPRIRIVSPANNALINTPSVRVTGTVPVGDALVAVNGVIATATGTSFSADVPLPQEGLNSILAIELVAGTRDTISVHRDTVPPALLTLLPANGTISSDDTVAFSGTVSEPSRVTALGPSGSVSGETTGVAAPPPTQPFSLPALALAPGNNDLTVIAQDEAGNTATALVRIARSAAALSLMAPPAGSSVATTRVDLTLEATEPVTIQALYSAGRRVPGAEGLALPAGTSVLNQVPLSAGPTEVRIAYARDSGPTETVSFQLTSTSTDVATVQGTVTDADTGDPVANAQVFVTVNGLTLGTLSGADGSFSVELEAGGLDGIVSSEGFASGPFSGSVAAGDTFDANLALSPTGLPAFSNEVEILVPPNGTVTDLDLVTVVGNVLNPTSSVLVNGIPAEVLGSRFTARSVPLAMGSNRIEVQAVASGSPVATDAVAVERAAKPVLAVTLYSPPDGATSPGNGLVVRGFVSGKGAITAVGGTFTATDQGVFAVNDVLLPVGQHPLRAETTLPDRSQTAGTAITVDVAEEGRALTLRAQPLVGPAPLAVDLSIFTEVTTPFSLLRMDIDTNGDGTIDAFDFPGSELTTVLSEIRGHAPRVFGTLPDGVEVTAAAAVNVHGQPVVVREFAQGNPVDLAPGPSGGLYVLDSAAATVSLYDVDGNLLSSFGSMGVGADQLLDPQGIGLAPNGEIYVADSGNARVQVFAADGTFLRTIGGPSQLTAPRDVFVVDDRVLVSDAGSDRLHLFQLDGTSLGALGIASPRHIQTLGLHGVVVASPEDQLVSFVDDRLRALEAPIVFSPENRPAAPVDASLGSGAVWVAEANEPVVRVYTVQFEFQQLLELDTVALSLQASPRREAQAVFVADGARVLEVASPIPSPIPVVESLRTALLAGDAATALELILPIQRPLFEQIYADVAADLPAHGAAMGAFEVDLLRADRAIVNTTISAPGTGEPLVVPIKLVRDGSGTWFIADY